MRLRRLDSSLGMLYKGMGGRGRVIKDKESTIRASLLVGEGIVDILNHINFSAGREVGTVHPVRRPHATDRAGHVLNIGNEEAMSIGFVALDPHG